MQGAPITALNEGLRTFKDDLIKNPLASLRVEVAVVTFDNDVKVVQDFVTADQFEPPTLTAQGLTLMGAAIHKALDMIQARKAQYRANGVLYYRPWVFMITDGEPQGEPNEVMEQAAQCIKDDETNKHIVFFAVGVENANITRLSQVIVRTPLKLKGLRFTELFVWLSDSLGKVSGSKVGEQVPLSPPGWGTAS